uniref:Uncharacterized protein n=1 Tax=Tanacetum cinerariifolium TaxID=118510 RepID=A0A6L2MKK2_TANCI|nr:hypothetical protein [Tanacetum cinerariifolium]
MVMANHRNDLELATCPIWIGQGEHDIVSQSEDVYRGFEIMLFYPIEPIDEVLRDRIIRHPFKAQTFPESILYLAGLASSWWYALNAPSIFIDDEGKIHELAASLDLVKLLTFFARHVDQPVDVGGPSVDHSKVPSRGGCCSKVREEAFNNCYSEEGATKVRIVAPGSTSRHKAKKQKQEGLRSMSSQGSVPHLLTSTPKGVRTSVLKHDMSKLENNLSKAQKNQDEEGSQVMKDLRVEGRRFSKELSTLHDVAKSLEDSRKELTEEEALSFVEAIRLRDVEGLTDRLKVVDLEWTELVKDFFLLAVKKLISSDHFNQAMVTCNRKLWFLIFDEAAKAFKKVEFRYISLLLEDAGKSLRELSAIEPPACQESASAPQ